MDACTSCTRERKWLRRGLCYTCYTRIGPYAGYKRKVSPQSALDGALCVDRDPVEQKRLQRLFASTDPDDHYDARELCRECPAILGCASALAAAFAAATPGYGPEGTWAGRLLGTRERVA